MKQVRWWLAVIGIPIAALSIISLVQRWLDVGLATGFGELVEYYRTYSRMIVGYLPDLLPFDFPPLFYDLWALSLFFAAIQMRATLMTEAAKGRTSMSPSYILGGVLFMLFLTYSFLGLLFGFYSIASALSAMTIGGVWERISTPDLDMRRYANWLLGSFAASIVAVAIFFALNAYAPAL